MWEVVTKGKVVLSGHESSETTERLNVEGGWCVRTVVRSLNSGDVSVAQTFVPDPEHKWKLENESSG